MQYFVSWCECFTNIIYTETSLQSDPHKACKTEYSEILKQENEFAFDHMLDVPYSEVFKYVKK